MQNPSHHLASDLSLPSPSPIERAHAVHDAAMAAIEFDEWFGRSVMTTDAKPGGRPSTFYQGARQAFEPDEFRPNKDGLIFFAADPRYITRSVINTTHIIPVHLHATDPFRHIDPAHIDALEITNPQERDAIEIGDWSFIERIAGKIRSAGFDAIELVEFVGEDDDIEFHNIAVFEASQIRSAIRGVPLHASPRLRFNLR